MTVPAAIGMQRRNTRRAGDMAPSLGPRPPGDAEPAEKGGMQPNSTSPTAFFPALAPRRGGRFPARPEKTRTAAGHTAAPWQALPEPPPELS
jgi:hypothetical protein